MGGLEAVDNLLDGAPVDGLVFLNYGDPAYRHPTDATTGLTGSESIFLRLVAYLTFAEAACVPARHILEGDAMAEAVSWAVPLLDEGLLLPERRVEAMSFEELARSRELPEIGFKRAEFLDAHASRVRRLVWRELAVTYKEILDSDLAPGGAFRRTVVGGMTGKHAVALDRAFDFHRQFGDGAPEIFVKGVAKFAPVLARQARRWAMARYYTTPLMYDSANTREIPKSAADLLVRGRVLDSSMRPFEKAAPAEAAFHRLQASVPANSIATTYRHYCEALLEVRRELPEARRIFSDVREKAQLKDAGETLSELFKKELARQQGVRPGSGRTFTLVSSLLSSAAGGALSFASGSDVALGAGVGFAFGVASNAASAEVQAKILKQRDRKRRPWVLAMDQLDKRVADGGGR
jgi:hypothetical protein